jgi:hypothetical protein
MRRGICDFARSWSYDREFYRIFRILYILQCQRCKNLYTTPRVGKCVLKTKKIRKYALVVWSSGTVTACTACVKSNPARVFGGSFYKKMSTWYIVALLLLHTLKNGPAYYNAGVVELNPEVVHRIGSRCGTMYAILGTMSFALAPRFQK